MSINDLSVLGVPLSVIHKFTDTNPIPPSLGLSVTAFEQRKAKSINSPQTTQTPSNRISEFLIRTLSALAVSPDSYVLAGDRDISTAAQLHFTLLADCANRTLAAIKPPLLQIAPPRLPTATPYSIIASRPQELNNLIVESLLRVPAPSTNSIDLNIANESILSSIAMSSAKLRAIQPAGNEATNTINIAAAALSTAAKSLQLELLLPIPQDSIAPSLNSQLTDLTNLLVSKVDTPNMASDDSAYIGDDLIDLLCAAIIKATAPTIDSHPLPVYVIAIETIQLTLNSIDILGAYERITK